MHKVWRSIFLPVTTRVAESLVATTEIERLLQRDDGIDPGKLLGEVVVARGELCG